MREEPFIKTEEERRERNAGRPNHYLPVALFSFIALLTFLAYLRSLHAPLVFDDLMIIKPSKLKSVLNHFSLRARSIADLSFALNYHFWGMNIAVFRITNVVFHVLSALSASYLTYVTLTLPSMRDKYRDFSEGRTSSYIALFVAALFLLHPIQTSAVNYITQRMAIMAGMFSLAGMIAYVKGATNTGGKAISYYAISILAFFLAVFSKENAMMILPMLVVYDFVFLSSFKWNEFRRRFIPILMLLILLAAATVYFFQAGYYINKIMMLLSSPHKPLETFGWSGMDINWTPLEYLLTEFRIVSRYILLILIPAPSFMVFDYSSAYPVSTSLFSPITTLFSLFFLASLLILSIMYIRRTPLISFGILWYLTAISLESFIALGLDPYFEHRNYLPCFGLFLALASLLVYADKPKVRVKKEVIISLAALLLFVLTFTRNGVWRDGMFLWEEAVRKAPNNARARANLGSDYTGKGLTDKAIEQLHIALKLKPQSDVAHANLGIAYMKKGWLDKAVEEYRAALQLRPDYYDAHYNMGLAFFEKGLLDEAIEEYQAALKINPEMAEAHVNLGIAYSRKELMDKAVEHFQIAVELEPEFAEAHNNLGIAYGMLGWTDKAVEQYRIALKIKPDYARARENLENILSKSARGGPVDRAGEHNNIGNELFRKGLIDKAMEQYRIAIRLNPKIAEPHHNLGGCFFMKGLMDKAIEEFQIALKLNPNYVEAHKSLGKAYTKKGLTDKAVEQLEIALKLNPNDAASKEMLAYFRDKKVFDETAQKQTGPNRR